MSKTNFDDYLEEQMKDSAFVARFERAGEAWGAALTASALRRQTDMQESKGEADCQGDVTEGFSI
jgi:hypothetical protein